MKKTMLFTLLIFFGIINTNNCQSAFSIYSGGGINYMPMEGFLEDDVYLLFNDKNKISFSGNIGVKYSLSPGKQLFFEIEYISSNAAENGGYSNHLLEISTIPLTVGYMHHLNYDKEKFNIYVGLGVSFVITKGESVFYSLDKEVLTSSDYTGGVIARCGFTKSLAEGLTLICELKYRYIGKAEIYKPSLTQGINLSGLSLMAGFEIPL